VLIERRAAAWLTAATGCLMVGAAMAPVARADGSGGHYGGVTCAFGGCEVRAEVHGGRAAGVGRQRSARSQRGLSWRGRSASSGRPTIKSDGWEFDLGEGMGILPRFDGEKPKKSKTKHKRKVSVEVVARRAVEKLALPKPVIRTSPDEDDVQVVGIPTWMWVQRSTWLPVTETAEVPGLRVTATASPRKAVWSMGESGAVTCTGPGTPYSGKFRPEEPSPDCGYTYRMSSLAEPGRVFAVSVQVTWDVEWRGGGRGGRVPGLVIAAERAIEVDEVQAVVVR
jgi:hypothetical protein